MSDIFISYAREDKRHAEALASTFRAEGWSVWWDDTLRAGTVFDDAIERELGAARCVVVLWSKHSIASRWVRAEVEDGANRGILVPVFIEAVVPPLSMRQIHAINLSGSTTADTSASLQQLIADVAAVLRDHRAQPSSRQLRWARSAAMLERASLEFVPLVLTLVAVLQGFSAGMVVLLGVSLALMDGFIATHRRDAVKWLLLCAAAVEGAIAAIAATPGGYDLIQQQSKYLVAFVIVRSGIASYMMRQLRP